MDSAILGNALDCGAGMGGMRAVRVAPAKTAGRIRRATLSFFHMFDPPKKQVEEAQRADAACALMTYRTAYILAQIELRRRPDAANEGTQSIDKIVKTDDPLN
jgi:hypothetical protein